MSLTDAGRSLALVNEHAKNLEPSMVFMVVMFMLHTTEHNRTQQNYSHYCNYCHYRNAGLQVQAKSEDTWGRWLLAPK